MRHPHKRRYQDRSKIGNALPESITCLVYLEYDNSVRIDLARNVSTDFL